MRTRRRTKKCFGLIMAAVLLVGLIAILSALKNIPWIAENVFTKGISRWYIFIVGNVTGILPFSLFEILCGAAIIALIVSIVKWIYYLSKKRFARLAKSFMRAVVITLSVVLLYTVTASFAYYRDDIDGAIPMQSADDLTAEQVKAVVNYYVTDFNALADKMERDGDNVTVCSYSFDELSDILTEEYKRLSSDYFNEYTPRAKSMISGDIVLAFGILGISFQPTGEPNVNCRTVSIDLPCIMAHEMAHAKGVMRENDAELVAAYLLLTSENEYLRYSGYCNYFSYIKQILSLNSITDFFETVKINPLIDVDYKYRYDFYNGYESFIDKIGDFINDLYLKSSGVKSGTDSYNVKGYTEAPAEGEKPKIVYSDIQKMMFAFYFSIS